MDIITWTQFVERHRPTIEEQERALTAAGIDPDPATWTLETLQAAGAVLDRLCGEA